MNWESFMYERGVLYVRTGSPLCMKGESFIYERGVLYV